MFKIIKATDVDIIETINLLIYGEAGAGKTSLSFTASKPILFDFDNGSHRSEFKKSRIKIRDWQTDIVDNYKTINEDLEKYQTIVIDTIDMALQTLGAWIIKRNSKYGMAKYKLQYYGELKDEFAKFISILNSLKKDVIMIAHVKEKDEGDVRIKRPQVTGGTYDRVLQISDFVGYLYIDNQGRRLDFNPGEFHIGKNSAHFKTLNVPNFKDEPNYLRSLVKLMKSSLGEIALTQKQILEMIKKQKIEKLETIEEIIKRMEELKNYQPIVKQQLWEKIKIRALELGYEYHKADKQFYKAEVKDEIISNDN